MSAAVAALAVGVVGTAGSMYMSNKASGAAADAAAQGSAEAALANANNLGFQKEQYESAMQDVADLEDIFGPIQDNMAEYYNNISPEMYQLQGKEAIENQYKRSKESLDAAFSNNGMFNSGQNANARAALEASREATLGANRQNAVNQYQNDEMQWLNFGSNQLNQNKSFAYNAGAGVSNVYNQQANTALNSGQTMASIHSN